MVQIVRGSCVVVLCVVVVVLSAARANGAQCNAFPNCNLTSADMAPAKFAVSQQDCCNSCAATGGCVAAVYAAYYCHLKHEVGNVVASSGSVALMVAFSPTSSPTSPAPSQTPQPTTAPITPQPSPTPAPTVTVIREVTCRYSSHCNQSNDNQCYQTVYYNDTCHKKHKRICGEYHISVEAYSDDGCRGVITSTEKEDMNVCQYVDYSYYGHYCDVQHAPQVGLEILRTSCPYGCNSGPECSSFNLTTGVCLPSNPFGSLPGNSVMGWCFPEYVVFSAYGSSDCSGPIADSRAEPLGCWENGYTQMQNICG